MVHREATVTNWTNIDQIEVSKADTTYAVRIRCMGLTAYGNTYNEAVEKVLRMRQAYLNVKEAING
ncbi:hypothetical protein LCGC14_0264410 [marine sediment metagenome]|uniref:Uncharacterized protein n=1 Tax=marine sediment metagenome TaxID=412755 RepID=A0A0F9U5K3_9ZZZZ